MPDPMNFREKVLLFAIEGTYGTDAAPTGALNAVLAKDVKVMPMEGADVSRELDTPNMGNQPTIPNELHSKFTFQVELAPSGAAGTAPAWGVLLRACACAEVITADTSVAYNPVTNSHESGTLYFNVDGTLYKSVGCRGTAKFVIDAQGVPMIEFELIGLYATPTSSALPTPDYTAWQDPKVATTQNTPTFTIAGTSLVMRSFSLDLANKVENRFLIGRDAVLITDREDMIETRVEAVPLTTLDPYSLAEGQTKVAVQLVHGTAAGNIATLDVPKAQVQRPQGLEDAQGIVEWPLNLVPLPDSGNDQWTLTLT